MRSYLSQRTFRAILENKPYTHLRCRQRPAVSSRASQCHCLYKIQRRYLFGFPAVSPDTVAQAETKKGRHVDFGGHRMRELMEALEEKSQSTPDTIAKAFSSFIQHRLENPTTITAAQAKFLLWAWEYLDGAIKVNQSADLDQNIAQPEDILNALSRSQWEPYARNNVNALAKSAFQKVCSQLGPETGANPSREVLYPYLHILASTGEFRDALQVIENYRPSVLKSAGIKPWIPVAKGALKEGPDELNMVLKHMKQNDIQLDQKSHEMLTVAAANQPVAFTSKFIYEYKINNRLQPTLAATLATATAMIWHGKAGWARDLLTVPRRNPTPEVRDAVLLLAVKKGQGADVVDKKLADLCTINPDLKSTLTITTFNKLLEFKVIKREYDGIDDLVSLAKAWGLEPDAFTGMSRVSARLHAGDIPGAMCLWEELDLGEVTEGNNNVTLWNIIMRQLCLAAQADPDDETVLAFIDRLLESDCPLEATTLEEICRMLLLRHDLEGISELLKPFVSSCSIPGLSQVLKPFAQFIADQKESAETSWEVHELLTRAVPYAPVGFWTNTMKQFFKRGRPDLACLAFGHMRKKVNPQDRPTAQTYAICLHGLAKTGYAEGIFLVHNMLKLDVEVQWTRTLLHKLMAAYISCGDPEQAMEFFRVILHSEEGPSYYSITLFFRACATYRKGLQEATQMVEKLKSLNIPLNRRAYNNYIRVLSTHGELERATEAISAMRAEIEEHPTEATIGLLYNHLPNQKWRDQAESWARIAYPDLWAGLEKLPTTVDEDGVRSFDLADRDGEENDH
ncbi:hypothetical protein ACJ72_03356 [Emergomyces africanus]|uniref:Mitochondrial respiratory complex I chaperone n=1 Tax=Emergomyces africanus TaxID=1955775 RepID=A0A1B7NZW0_9EURO|nr:hypothetical protein ACJ72_03356 [Emergomyces africanus]